MLLHRHILLSGTSFFHPVLERKVRYIQHILIRQHHSFLYILVRLDGSIKGRIGVRRDLETDMKRIKDMGTGCIIWCDLICLLPFAWFKSFSLDCSCLDDNELEFLGAPWSEYERCASRTGLDVLR